jgi:F0F1-type ATP synthase assembly protein I
MRGVSGYAGSGATAAQRLPYKHAVRDGLVAVATLSLWWVDAGLQSRGGGLALLVALLAGVMTAYCGYLVHEWGHLLGALSAGSVVHLPRRLFSVFLFRFDSDLNDRRQFLRMSMGGFIASALVVALLLAVLPLDARSGQIALALVLLGVVATFVLEVPVAWRVARGAPLPRGAAYRSSAGARTAA